MKTNAILGISLTAIFAIGMITAASAGEISSWIGASGGDAEMKNAKVWRLSVTALDTIPEKDEITDLAGFGWLYEQFDPSDDDVDAFGVVIHNADLNGDGKNDVRDSLQNKEGFHGHNFIFSPGAGDASLCVAEIADAPTSGISVDGDFMQVNLRDSQTADTFMDDVAVGYLIIVEPECDATVPTGEVVDQDILDDLELPDGLPLGIILLD